MVLESLFNPFKAEKKPWEIFLIGVVYSSIALLLARSIFEMEASLVMVFLTTLAGAPLIYSTIKYEEKKDITIDGEGRILKEHAKALKMFTMLFLGMTLSFATWYVFLPGGDLATTFNFQTKAIMDINTAMTGNAAGIGTLSRIFFNNFWVMIYCILFSFLYGIGALFIMTWNASVIGVAMGNFIRTGISAATELIGMDKVSAHFSVVSVGLFRYAIHGIPEVVAYFVAGLAGGIISVAVIRHDLSTSRYKKILLDAVDLLLISVGLLAVAAILEVYVTPAIF